MTVVLYRCHTPTDWLCPCGRVKRELVRAGEDVREVRVPWAKGDRRDVRALTGQTVVPVAVIDGDAICDSRRIRQHLSRRAQAVTGPSRMD
ncbi:glutathione S-transferase N-terminal domain-containing protein [Paraconexibacter antarcticus]|uniref:Glutathione S-transferase N-terminal domain-containing protein n=1 Tax=Paraconexibacter antarcticus TaxID=2949664 RepID=A0ABY5DUN7_9ACTN|nr:glutathione S-transferase N-terminal domain-containing protein [Paraconexibacter antarcticus]UTI65721.1 glutathione S-transferase N-terminal domain-containing protein [Paraconexibacter antarcticus]